MPRYSHAHLSDPVLDRELNAAVVQNRGATALLLSYLAEFDARRRYAPAGFPSMFAFCVEKLGFSEDEAGRRIQAARVAKKLPGIFEALAQGRLHTDRGEPAGCAPDTGERRRASGVGGESEPGRD